ncbi:MAG TPA: AMP-binding protein, partial [Burkholderiaceae bacterium]|nr:AMP-binding protein [Burkholderiaceae bacterium]
MTVVFQAATLPLIRHFQEGTALAWNDHAISPQQFLTQAAKLASDLPTCRYVVNLCEDRYHFLLAFAAALISGKQTLTPPSRAPLAIDRIQQEFTDSHIIDDQMIADHCQRFPAAAETSDATRLAIPEIPVDQIAITLFTSGSSGQPTAHSKTWGMLVQGANQLQRAFGVEPGSCVLGTVPPQHMYGLESTIIFPLQWGCTIHHERPLLPADIEQAIAKYEQDSAQTPLWLMT